MRTIAGVVLLCLAAFAAVADSSDGSRLRALEREYQELRQRTESELDRLSRAIEALREEAEADSGRENATPSSPASASTAPAAPPAAPITGPDLPVALSGDFRLRYEHTTNAPPDEPSRSRGVLRSRLAAEYQPAEHWSVGARLTTGDPDDPNSTDVTLGNFTDDLSVSLDRAYLAWDGERARLLAGKFANPLRGTDLVWDGDVSPQGMAGGWRLLDRDRLQVDLTALYGLVDEQSAGPDSDLRGGQISFGFEAESGWQGTAHAGYYDYDIGSLANADAGDVRGNRLNVDGTAYLSDYDLLNLLAEVTVPMGDARWPMTFTADYVRNLGTAGADDDGWSGALSIGRQDAPGDVRIGYGFTVAESDAVFAAYSHDNLTYATNYRLHALTLEYVPWPSMRLNLTGYRYRRDEPLAGVDNDAITRIRLNWSVLF